MHTCSGFVFICYFQFSSYDLVIYFSVSASLLILLALVTLLLSLVFSYVQIFFSFAGLLLFSAFNKFFDDTIQLPFPTLFPFLTHSIWLSAAFSLTFNTHQVIDIFSYIWLFITGLFYFYFQLMFSFFYLLASVRPFFSFITTNFSNQYSHCILKSQFISFEAKNSTRTQQLNSEY